MSTKKNIVLNERKLASKMIESGSLGKNAYETLCVIAKTHLSDGCSKKHTRQLLEEFVLQCVPGSSLVEWSVLLDNVMKSAAKYRLIEIEFIGVTRKELDCIQSLPGKQLQRLAFTLLCVSKYWDIVTESDRHWANCLDSEIMKMANISTSVRRQSLLFSQLRDAGMIRFSNKVDNLNVQVLFQDDGEPVMKIKDFRNLGYQYLNYIEGGYFQCVNCGLTVKDERIKNGAVVKRGRKAMYCKDCATEIHLQQMVNSVMRRRSNK